MRYTQQFIREFFAIICAVVLLPANPSFANQEQQTSQQNVKIPQEQLDALVAPIALYPDQLLSQTLVASTYPLEIMQLQQWLERNKGLKDRALADAVSKQPWDPSIQAMAALPDLVNRLAQDIQWTTDLGNAFLAQQSDVMNAIQRMRAKAQTNGTLESNDKQTVETEIVENKDVIVIEQADPEVVYVPSYNPTAVYGPPVYPYPSIYYPAYTPGAVLASSAISFGVGMAMGAAWGGGWGWGFGWGNNDIDINMNNNFNRSANLNAARGTRNTWQHNPRHRGGAPYADRATANRFGSNARGDSLASRQRGAQQQISRQKGNLGSVRDRGAPGGTANRAGIGDRGGLGAGAGSRAGISDRGSLGSAGSRNIGGADRIGSRSLGSSSSIGNRSAFGGGSGGYSRTSARSSSMRGSSSLGSRGGGGFSGRGGGGGFRGGGGGRGGGRR
jgi:hypothetical protein